MPNPGQLPDSVTSCVLPSSFFSSRLVSVHVVHPYSSIDTTAAWKKLRFILCSVPIALSADSAPGLKTSIVIYFSDTYTLYGYSSFWHLTYAIHVAFRLSFAYFKTQLPRIFEILLLTIYNNGNEGMSYIPQSLSLMLNAGQPFLCVCVGEGLTSLQGIQSAYSKPHR